MKILKHNLNKRICINLHEKADVNVKIIRTFLDVYSIKESDFDDDHLYKNILKIIKSIKPASYKKDVRLTTKQHKQLKCIQKLVNDNLRDQSVNLSHICQGIIEANKSLHMEKKAPPPDKKNYERTLAYLSEKTLQHIQTCKKFLDKEYCKKFGKSEIVRLALLNLLRRNKKNLANNVLRAKQVRKCKKKRQTLFLYEKTAKDAYEKAWNLLERRRISAYVRDFIRPEFFWYIRDRCCDKIKFKISNNLIIEAAVLSFHPELSKHNS